MIDRLKKLMVIALASTTLTSGALAQEEGGGGGTLIVAQGADVRGFYSAKVTDIPSLLVLKNIYDYLVIIDRNGEYVPRLATSWEASDDLRIWTFQLREGVKFTDGTDFNADAVVFNYERYMDPKIYAGGPTKYANIESIEALDELAVRFTLKEPMVAFIHALVNEYTPMMASPTAIELHGEDYVFNPVGTGPFMLKEFIRSQRTELVRNPGYWGEPVKLDGIIYRPIPDPETALLELETGGIHIATVVPPENLAMLEAHPDITVQASPNHTMRGLFFNFASPRIQDINVRRAIAHAVNVEEIVTEIAGDSVVPAVGPTPRLSWAHNENLIAPAYDPELALELLAEAGWERGRNGKLTKDGEALTIRILSPTGRFIKDREIISAVAYDMEQVGITVQLELLEGSAWSTRTATGEGFDMGFGGAGPRPAEPDAQPISVMLRTGGSVNHYSYSNTELDTLMVEASKLSDQAERKAIYDQVQELVMDDVAALWLYSDRSIVGVRNEVKGYEHSGVQLDGVYNSVYLED